MAHEGEAVAGPGWRTQFGIGVVLVAVAAAIWLDATRLPPPAAVGVGPSAAMRLVSVLVALLGVAHFVVAWRHRARTAAHAEKPLPIGNRAALAWVLGGLLGLIAILQLGGGFILAATWLFVGTACGFGERVSVKSVVAGLVLTTIIYLFFTKGLSLGLPAGPVERLFG